MPASYTPDPIVSAEDMQAINPPPQDPTTWAKFSRKFKEEPLVPIGKPYTPPPLAPTPNRTDGLTDLWMPRRPPATGCLATVAALLGASSALQKGNRTQFNMFLRYRVAAQGLTLIAALGAANFIGSRTGRRSQFKSADLVSLPFALVVLPYRWFGLLWCPTEGATGSRSRSKSSSSCCLCITNPCMISSLPAIVLSVSTPL